MASPKNENEVIVKIAKSMNKPASAKRIVEVLFLLARQGLIREFDPAQVAVWLHEKKEQGGRSYLKSSNSFQDWVKLHRLLEKTPLLMLEEAVVTVDVSLAKEFNEQIDVTVDGEMSIRVIAPGFKVQWAQSEAKKWDVVNRKHTAASNNQEQELIASWRDHFYVVGRFSTAEFETHQSSLEKYCKTVYIEKRARSPKDSQDKLACPLFFQWLQEHYLHLIEKAELHQVTRGDLLTTRKEIQAEPLEESRLQRRL